MTDDAALKSLNRRGATANARAITIYY